MSCTHSLRKLVDFQCQSLQERWRVKDWRKWKKGETKRRILMRCGGTVWIFKKKLHHHKTKSYELQVQSNSTLFVLFNCHQLNAARHCPQPRLSIILVGADCWGARTVRSCDVHTHTHKKKKHTKGQKMGLWLLGCAGRWGERKCLRDPSVLWGKAGIICLQQLLPLARVYCHERSPPTPRFLCLTVWWPTPLPPDPDADRGTVLRNITCSDRYKSIIRRSYWGTLRAVSPCRRWPR